MLPVGPRHLLLDPPPFRFCFFPRCLCPHSARRGGRCPAACAAAGSPDSSSGTRSRVCARQATAPASLASYVVFGEGAAGLERRKTPKSSTEKSRRKTQRWDVRAEICDVQLRLSFYFDSAETMATKRCLITCRYNFHVFKASQLKARADF